MEDNTNLIKNYDFTSVSKKDIEFFKKVCGEEHVFRGDEIVEDFARDEMTPESLWKYPEVMVEVIKSEQISEIMKYCSSRNLPVTPRGQGTGLCGGCIPLYGGVLLNMNTMNKIIELDEENLTLVVEPGALIMEIRSFVEEKGLFYAPMPGEQSATIGGNISTNAGGIKAVKYGVTREWVRGLEIVLPSGEIIELDGDLAKNSSGYSLKNLIIGSEGTLAIVTKAWLKLIPQPKHMVSLLVPFPDYESAIEAVPSIIIKSKVLPTSLEFMERDVILDAEEYLGKKFPDNTSDAYLLISLDGSDKAAIEKEYEAVANVCLELGAIDVFISDTPERQESIWATRSAFLEGIKGCTTEIDEIDAVVPRSEISKFLQYTLVMQKEHDIRLKTFAHAADGNVHVYVLKDQLEQEEWEEKLHKIMDALYAKAKELGGNVSGEHGIGFLKKGDLEHQYQTDPAVLRLMKQIKKMFDPKNILNPGKVVDI
ncbi:MAG: FAD-binding oxidoreductase [Promethearchaeota archaeon]